MTRNKEPQKAQFNDSDEIDQAAVYDDIPNLGVLGGSEEFHYFMAAKAEDGSQQTVEACKLAGYEVCTEERPAHPAFDRVLMRIPMRIFQARRDAKRKRRIASRKSIMRPQGIPGEHLYELGGRGERPGQRGEHEEWEDEG